MLCPSFNIFALNPALLLCLCTCILLSPYPAAASLHHPYPTPQLPLQIPPQQPSHNTNANINAKSWFSRARDHLINSIWPTPIQTGLTKANGKASTLAGPPPTLLASYGGDLVLRFEINSIHEADALAQAINVLFLDVWEFTTDWVDIRLSKDVVSCEDNAATTTF